jgi:hypothetical protein
MFRTSQGPSSGSHELCLTEVTDIGSVLPVVSRMASVWLRILTLVVCVCGAGQRCTVIYLLQFLKQINLATTYARM